MKLKVSDDEIVRVSKMSLTANEAAKKLGITFRAYKNNATRLGCYVCNQGGKGIAGSLKYNIDALRTKHDLKSAQIKKILFRSGAKKEQCEMCGIGPSWNGRMLSLQLHHIDGNCRNNDISNLMILCPNCHSQTENFGSKNKFKYETGMSRRSVDGKRIDKLHVRDQKDEKVCKGCGKKMWRHSKGLFCIGCLHKFSKIPEKNNLMCLIRAKPYREIGRMFGVSSTTVKRWAARQGIALEKRTTRMFG